jgi:hypothetical protein
VDTPSRPRSWLFNILFFPIGCLIQTPPIILLAVVLVGAMASMLLHSGVKINFGSTVLPDFKDYQINRDYSHVQRTDGAYWTITYEKSDTSVFSGLVRHASSIQEEGFPLLTHDILITSGDFANPDLVHTSVVDHHFSWTSTRTSSPQGTINLLHTVPLNDAIFQQLSTVADGQQVTISGMEILRINAYKPDDSLISYWQDSGCNSLVVTTVVMQPGN